MIYFVECGGLVKIGKATDVRARLSSMQTGNPEPMTLLGEVPGGRADESDLHQRFRSFRVRGEWFRYSGELRTFIDETVATAADTATPYGLFDADSAFLGVFYDGAPKLANAYAQAHRAVPWSSVGQWWRFGEGWEEGTNPYGGDPVAYYKHLKRIRPDLDVRTVLCTLHDASAFECSAEESALRRILKKAKEF